MAHSAKQLQDGLQANGEVKDGCAYRCLNPDCNDATFDRSATCCAHCGQQQLLAEHPGGVFDRLRQAFICGDCGAAYPANK